MLTASQLKSKRPVDRPNGSVSVYPELTTHLVARNTSDAPADLVIEYILSI